MTVKLAYTFGTDGLMPYPGDTYVVLETETMEQQRPFAAAVFGYAKHVLDSGEVRQGGVNFAFDYPLDEFENGRPGKPSQVEKWSYAKAAEFSLLPVIDGTDNPDARIAELLENYMDIDGAHHKQWLLEQIADLVGVEHESEGIAP